MAEYIDREAVYAEACRGCIRHGEHIGECYSEEPCQKLIEVFALAPAVDLIPAVCKESSGEQSRWVSVEKRLPIDETKDYQEKWEENPEFLVMIKYGVVPTCLYFDGVNWYANDGEPFTYNVTHWMPLPEPPKENRPG